ncbi:MAG: Dipeptidyl-peptidase 5 [Candidatus Anoxychlamydiales bacterium]|nr:Dipeptidyl-peptidase 5 [Candidatus Anoxychlamydiales bacterium]NGX40672.1 Dipeptidyl-peptidase 5 [Candidatus Anoxychlamydiales bacterium]
MISFKKLYILLIFTISFFISSIFASTEIEVSLSTKNSIKPLYLSKIFNEGADFENSYLESLASVLKFDLNNSGFTKVLKTEYQNDFKVSHFDTDVAFDSSFWSNKRIAIVVKSQVMKKTLKTFVYNVGNNILKTFELELTGNLNIDRQKLHSLCDNIQEILFGQKGIFTSKILYSVRSKNELDKKFKWQSEIWIADIDGENAKKLTDQNSYLVHPIFIPNSKNEYLYISYLNGPPKIHKSSITNSKESKPIINLRGNQLLPAISKNGDKLAFISDAAGGPDLFLQHFDDNFQPIGKPLQLFSYPRSTQASPTFSPDGQKLAFVSDKDGGVRIYVIAISDNAYTRKRPVAHLITKKNRENVTPSWSKDGKKLAFSAKINNIRQICIYDFEKDEEWQLTYGANNKENPFWANDNLHIVFNTEDITETELYLININQKEAVKITKNEGKKRFPSFEP